MDIFYRKKSLIKITSVCELEAFLIDKKIYKFFKKFPDNRRNDIQEKINYTDKLPFKNLKKWVKDLLKYPESIYNFDFLYSMGWEREEIYEFISKLQKKNSKILSQKKKANPELYFSSTTSRIEYWISRGYSEEESKVKLSERQKTFSKQLCIERYGEIDGVNVFNDRQKKWITTLSNKSDYNTIQSKKNFYKYGHKKYEDMITKSSFLEMTKNLILKNIDCKNIEDFVRNILNEIDVKRYSDIHPYINSSIVCNRFNITKEKLRELFYNMSSFSPKNQTYGTPIYHKGNRFKSIREYELSIFLEEMGIEYVYEKKYPNSDSKFDFYLPIFNLYVEYYGMLDGKNLQKLDEVQTMYLEKMSKKNLFCEKNKLNLIYDTNYKNLINKLRNYIYENKN